MPTVIMISKLSSVTIGRDGEASSIRMDVILSQLTRAQLQTHSVEALHAELQQLEGVFKSAVQTLQRISSVRDTAATFLVDCDDSATLAYLTRIHALREDAAMRLDLLTSETHMHRVRYCV